jgi:hypothetical protein
MPEREPGNKTSKQNKEGSDKSRQPGAQKQNDREEEKGGPRPAPSPQRRPEKGERGRGDR